MLVQKTNGYMEKSYILAEIRRTARDGVSLGRSSFEKETGIKESDWKGKLWAKWSDAVREAGCEPNQKVEAFSDDWLIERVIQVVRQLGHFPTVAEWRLRKRDDPSLPNDKTLARFGSMAQIVARVHAYCSNRPDHGDVLVLCEPKLPEALQEPVVGRSSSSEQFGYVYLLRSGKHYKIGKSNAAGRRERELAIQLPERANMVHVIRTDDPDGIERYWHRRFELKRKNGEWFDLDGTDLAAFRRRKFM